MKYLYIALGFFFLGCGTVGVFLPLIPTTPFLLLSAFFFARSSKRWYNYLMNHRVFGKYLRDYQLGQMTLQNKVTTLTVMWIGMGVSAWFTRERIYVVILLFVIGMGTTIHLSRLTSPEHAGKRHELPKLKEELMTDAVSHS